MATSAESRTHTGPRPRIQTTRGHNTRAKLAVHVRAEIAERSGFSAERVAGRASVSVGTFWAHFGTKDEALAEALELVLTDVAEIMQRHMTIEQLLERGAGDVCAGMVNQLIEVFRADRHLVRLAVARIPDSDLVRDTFRRHEEVAVELVAKMIRLGQVAGKVAGGDPEVMARGVLVLGQSLSSPHLTGPVGNELQGRLAGSLVYFLTAPDPSASTTEER